MFSPLARRLPLTLLAALATAVLTPSEALAYCRSTTCQFGPGPCPKDANGCAKTGSHLHWDSSCMRYALQVDGSPKLNLDADQAAAIVQRAFETWRSVECPGGGTPSFDTTFQGYVACHQKDAICDSARQNVNVVMFQDDDWTEKTDSSSEGIALTTPTANTDTGEILDADIEVDTEWRPEFSSQLNLERTILHEVGHFLGLDHSSVKGAIMTTYYQNLPPEASLSQDDIEGICAIYPPSRGAPTCAATSTAAYEQCKEEPASNDACVTLQQPQAAGCGCRVGLGALGSGSSTGAAAGLSLLGLAALRLRTRRRLSERAAS